jgi:hypothetical protein
MKLLDITTESIKSVSNQELLSLHRRLHQLFSLAKSRKNIDKKFIKFLVSKHLIVIREMKRRGLTHNIHSLEI